MKTFINKLVQEGGDRLYRLYWVLPTLDATISAISFVSAKKPMIAVACVNFALYIFDVKERRMSKWSEKAGFPLSGSLPQDFSVRRDFPVRLSTDVTSPTKILMVSAPLKLSFSRCEQAQGLIPSTLCIDRSCVGLSPLLEKTVAPFRPLDRQHKEDPAV